MILTFYLTKKNNCTLPQIHIKFYLSTKGVNYDFELPLFIDSEDWDIEKQRPKNIYCKNYKELNNILIALKIELGNKLNINSGKYISKKKIYADINRICFEHHREYPKDSLLSVLSIYLKEKKQTVKLSTYRRYIVFKKFIEKFEGHISRRIYIEDIDSLLIKKIYSFGESESYSDTTILRSIHFIKTILNFAERQGVHTKVRRLEIPKNSLPRKVLILNEQEILKIQNTYVPKNLQTAKDWLSISCYTGQRVSDFMSFNLEKIIDIQGRKCISFIQQKTGKEIIIPLHPIVLNIIEKNGNSFPEALNIGTYNVQIKKVVQLAQINNIVKVKKRLGYRSKEIMIEKWKAVSSHIGRRSFASNFYGKIPTPLLMQATGHSSEKLFLKYINSINHERIASLGAYFDASYKKAS